MLYVNFSIGCWVLIFIATLLEPELKKESTLDLFLSSLLIGFIPVLNIFTVLGAICVIFDDFK